MEKDRYVMLETVSHAGVTISIIIRASFSKDGIHFFTPDSYSQQLAYMKYDLGHEIAPHTHNAVKRTVDFTQEVLFIKSGVVRVDYYDENRRYIESRVLRAGDVVMLAHGGHGFVVLEDCEIVEVKQGPYAGDQDKTRFVGVDVSRVVIKE